MDRLSALKKGSGKSLHKKQISIESKIERVVEDDDRSDLEWRNKLEPQVSVSIRRGSEVMIEDMPESTKSSADPLNWPTWKTEIAYGSLVLLTSTASILKLVLAPLNAVLSNEFDISYFQAACLTGIPIILGSPATFGSSILARVIGRRAVMLIGALLLFAGSTWNLKIGTNYAQFMVARAITGIGWGMIDAVIQDAVGDLFSHQRKTLRMNIFNAATSFNIWLAPVLSGHFYQRRSWRTMFLVVGIAQTVSLLLLIFLTPETQFSKASNTNLQPNHSSSEEEEEETSITAGEGKTSTTISSSSTTEPKPSKFKTYILHTLGFPKPPQPRTLFLPIKAMLAPSTILNFLLQAPLTASTYGLASSLALIFSIAPTFLRPARIGFLFALPAAFVPISYIAQVALDIWTARRLISKPTTTHTRSRTPSIALIIQLLILGAGSIAGLGLYTCNKLGPRMVLSSQVVTIVEGEMMNEERLWVVGALFGAAVAGSISVQLFGRAKLASTHFHHHHQQSDLQYKIETSENTEEEAEEKIHENETIARLIDTASRVYTSLLTGIFALTFPIWSSEGHRSSPSSSPSSSSSSSPLAPQTSSPAAAGPWRKRHGDEGVDEEVVKATMDMDMLMGIQITVVALAIVILVVSGLAALVIVFGKESLRRRDRKVLGFGGEGDRERDERRTDGDGEEIEMQ